VNAKDNRFYLQALGVSVLFVALLYVIWNAFHTPTNEIEALRNANETKTAVAMTAQALLGPLSTTTPATATVSPSPTFTLTFGFTSTATRTSTPTSHPIITFVVPSSTPRPTRVPPRPTQTNPPPPQPTNTPIRQPTNTPVPAPSNTRIPPPTTTRVAPSNTPAPPPQPTNTSEPPSATEPPPAITIVVTLPVP
jgi:hypothetical protein